MHLGEVSLEGWDNKYMCILMAIDLDTNKEAHYLAELAKGLGISTALANDIHDQLGVRKIFA